ncbi:MAG: hypothetical protein NTY41_14010 [Proteobacteria bacterium]|nr:hypothetical protein [Pseudomonadota bacterium]
MKHSVSSTCLAVAGILIAGLGSLNAADVAQPAMMRGGNAPHHAMQDPVVAAQTRLDKLGSKLNLKSSQQDAWKTFSTTMIKHAQEHAQEIEKRGPGERSKHDDIPTHNFP